VLRSGWTARFFSPLSFSLFPLPPPLSLSLSLSLSLTLSRTLTFARSFTVHPPRLFFRCRPLPPPAAAAAAPFQPIVSTSFFFLLFFRSCRTGIPRRTFAHGWFLRHEVQRRFGRRSGAARANDVPDCNHAKIQAALHLARLALTETWFWHFVCYGRACAVMRIGSWIK